MASMLLTTTAAAGAAARFSYSPPAADVLKQQTPSYLAVPARRRAAVVRAEGGVGAINPEIRKNEEKVVDSIVASELAKPLTVYCRCWRSATFPLCDGAHAKHNKATGDNVGPLLVKK